MTLLKLDPGVMTIDVMLVDPKLFPVPDPTARKNATWPPKYVMMMMMIRMMMMMIRMIRWFE